MTNIKLGVLDQSIVRHNSTVAEAIQETVETAQLAEKLGYTRFWVSEHHNSAFLAGSTPEVLMVKLAEVTKSIRIGSGGIMLPNHSALKVAENFRMLETLYPGRIDLGIGRAPGTDRVTSSILNPSNDFSESSYLRQLEHLQHYFRDTAETSYGPVLATPVCDTIPMQWILSSSGGSSKIAAKFGMGLAIAKFINGFVSPEVVDIYRKNFRPSDQYPEPHAILSTSVVCAETEEKAAELRKLMDFILLEFERGRFGPFPSPETIRKYQFSPGELERIEYNRNRIVSGTPESVKEQLIKLANDYEVDEIVISSRAAEHADRLKSFELLSDIFDLREIGTKE